MAQVMCDSKAQQHQRVLELCLRLAGKYQLPIVLHCRGEEEDCCILRCLELMKRTLAPDQAVHMHCFGGSMVEARACMESFPNTVFGVTAKMGQDEQDARHLRQLPLERIMLETDAPYLLPPVFWGSARDCNPGMILEAAKVPSVWMCSEHWVFVWVDSFIFCT